MKSFLSIATSALLAALAVGAALALPAAAAGTSGPALAYSTYLGGNGLDMGMDVAIAPNGDIVVGMYTNSTDFNVTNPSPLPYLPGVLNAAVLRFSPDGKTLVFSTLLAGSTIDQGFTGPYVAVDGDSIWVTGSTFSPFFPTTPGTVGRALNGVEDAYVARLNGTTGALRAASYLGGEAWEWPASIAVTAAGEVLISGVTNSSLFPITPDAYDTTYNGTNSYYNGVFDSFDAFVTLLDGNLSTVLHSTFHGGSRAEDGRIASALGADGTIYVTGATWSDDFPTTPEAFTNKSRGGSDAFISHLSADLSALLYSTVVGGSGRDFGTAIAVDAQGRAVITGYTESSNFNVTDITFDSTMNGTRDAFAAKIAANGSALVYSTYLGGSDNDTGLGVSLDAAGRAYLCGWTDSSDFPLKEPVDNTTVGREGYLMVLDSEVGAPLFSTLVGGNGYDWPSAVAADRAGAAILAGFTGSDDFPVTPGGSRLGNITAPLFDATLSRVQLNYPPSADFQVSPAEGTIWTLFSFNASATSDAETSSDALLFRWDVDGDGEWDGNFGDRISLDFVYTYPGNYTVRLEVMDTFGLVTSVSHLVRVLNTPPEAGFAVLPWKGSVATEFELNATPTYDREDRLPALEFRWDVDDDGVWDIGWSRAPVATHRYSDPGNYTIRLEARDSWGATDSTTRSVRIMDTVPVAAFSLTPSRGTVADLFTANASASFDLEYGGAGLQFRWDFGDGTPVTPWRATSVAEHRFAKPGNYTVRLDVLDLADNLNSTTASATVVETAPGAQFSVTPDHGNITTLFRFDASGSIDLESASGSLEVRWDFDGDGRWDTAWALEKNASARLPTPGPYLAHLEVRDGAGLIANASRPLVLHDEPPQASVLVRAGHLVCAGDCHVRGAFIVDATGSSDLEDNRSALLARWDFDGDAAWDTEWGPLTVSAGAYPGPGRYTLHVEIIDSAGNHALASMNITAEPASSPAANEPASTAWLALVLLPILLGVLVAALLGARRRAGRPRA